MGGELTSVVGEGGEELMDLKALFVVVVSRLVVGDGLSDFLLPLVEETGGGGLVGEAKPGDHGQ